jgi:hypothetical protein
MSVSAHKVKDCTDETLRRWHCGCGYANVGYDPCFGCHCRAPRQVRRNTVVIPAPISPVVVRLAEEDGPEP